LPVPSQCITSLADRRRVRKMAEDWNRSWYGHNTPSKRLDKAEVPGKQS
jgi:hypothetical protein